MNPWCFFRSNLQTHFPRRIVVIIHIPFGETHFTLKSHRSAAAIHRRIKLCCLYVLWFPWMRLMHSLRKTSFPLYQMCHFIPAKCSFYFTLLFICQSVVRNIIKGTTNQAFLKLVFLLCCIITTSCMIFLPTLVHPHWLKKIKKSDSEPPLVTCHSVFLLNMILLCFFCFLIAIVGTNTYDCKCRLCCCKISPRGNVKTWPDVNRSAFHDLLSRVHIWYWFSLQLPRRK